MAIFKASQPPSRLFLLAVWVWRTAAYVPVPFQTSKYYGVDGPWQAVTVQVGGFTNGTQDSAQWTSVDMMPGSFWETWALSSQLCTSGSSSDCGAGGTFNPGTNQTINGQTIFFEPSIAEPASASGIYATGEIYAQNLNVGGGGSQSFTTPNSTIVAVSMGNRTLPNGKEIDLELGIFGLGADSQTQLFSSGSTSTDDVGIYAWNMPGYLYNSSATKSNSYTIHIGSTAYDYPGSLVFGGYDKGRAIGPATTWGDTPPQLLDIVLGVEVGGSPFTFTSKSGLLLTNTSQNSPLPVYPNPMEPYLHLPKQTCDNLAKHLPVSFDSGSGYYLWNTHDPSYANITTSAAYLGFEFPPATGGTNNVVIKVPFQLLVLNLTEVASGKTGQTPYFPCMPYTPPASGAGAGGSGDNSYLLGRAFLQAAFVGRNWEQHVSWLAQAPGPGAAKQGLGFQPQDIQNSDTTLDLYTGDNYFNSSWADYWKPLPGATPAQPGGKSNSTSQPSISNSSTTTSSSGLSTGAKAGIGIGAAAVGILAIAAAVFLFMRRRRDRGSPAHGEAQPFVAAHYGDENKSDTPPYAHSNQPPYQDQPYPNHQPQGQPGAHQGNFIPYQQGAAGGIHEAYAPHKHDAPYGGSGGQQAMQLNELPGREQYERSELPGHSPTELEAAAAKSPVGTGSGDGDGR